jgi:serine/threonine protein kinase
MEMTFDGPARGGSQPAAGRSSQRLAPGVRLNDRYEIEELLGPSPYGENYRARDLASGQLVAIKALAPGLVADAPTMERLTQEIQVAAQLDHKNIAATYGLFGAQVGNDPVAYVAGEFVDGQSLREMLDKKRATGRAFSLKGAYNVIAHLCNALVYAHGATVHGALTPDAVMVNSAGRVKVCDFGLGRALKPQLDAGSLAALAPEATRAPDSVDARADIYSVGVILFELLSGLLPTSTKSPSLAAPGVAPSVDPVVEQCLQASPAARFADAQALKDALQTALAADLAGPNAQSAAAIPANRQPPNATAMSSAPKQPSAPLKPMPMVNTPTPPPRPIAVSTPTPPPISSAPKPPPQQRPPQTPPPSTSLPMSHSRPQLPSQPSVPKSFNVDAALSAVDDTSERWLIQKDKLDFGPFNMREVRSQIETGKIQGEHVIIDTENGERRKVKDHPQLRAAVTEAEARLSLEQREKEEASERKKHRGMITLLLGGIFLAVIGGGGTIFYYYEHHQKIVVQRELVRDDSYDFMKGVEISMKVDPPAAKKPTHGGGGHKSKNGKGDEFSDVTNLGDASEGGGEETLGQDVVQRVMTQNFRVLVGCISEERRRNGSLHSVDMDFVIKGSGQVSAVKVNGSTSSTLAGCMYGKMQSVAFPKFNGNKTHASFSLALK